MRIPCGDPSLKDSHLKVLVTLYAANAQCGRFIETD